MMRQNSSETVPANSPGVLDDSGLSVFLISVMAPVPFLSRMARGSLMALVFLRSLMTLVS